MKNKIYVCKIERVEDIIKNNILSQKSHIQHLDS